VDAQQAFKIGSTAYDAHDFSTAVFHLLPLAIQGHKDAQYLMANMYRWGDGIDQSPEKSLFFYKAAADQGHARAALDLFLLLEPTGTSAPPPMQSLQKDAAASQHYLGIAVARFKELAEVGDVEAMSNLGFLYHHGFGVELDGAEAIRWYTKAFEGGGHGASNGLCLVHYEGDPRVRDKAKARFWYEMTKAFDCQCIGIDEFEEPTVS
jgi:TPR repeat protein